MKKKKYYFLSFIIPFISIILLYLSVGVIGGNRNILTVDLANQYVEFFSALKSVLSGNMSAFYSFSKTLGGNFFGVMTYYLMSPLNLLVVFFKKIDIPKFVLIINIIKIALSGLTSYIYFNKTFKRDKLSLAFSITYSLMAYNIVYSQNIMWLDGVVMLPIIFLGVDRLIEKRPLLFYVSLTLSIIFNYYIGYMSCIAAFIYYIYQVYVRNSVIKKDDIILCIKYILISVLTSGFVLIPSLYSLLQGKASGLLGEFVPNQKFALFDLITRFYIGTFKNSDLLGTLPNVYISQIMIFLVIYYFYNDKVDKSEKRSSLILILMFAVGFLFSPINTIWHTLKNPVGFPFRYSFMFDFILLIIAYKSILKLEEIDKSFMKKFLFYSLIVTLFIDKMLYTNTMYYKIIGTFILVVIYMLYLIKRKSKEISTLILLLITAEMFLNGFTVVYNIKYQRREKYENFINTTGEVVDDINKKENTLFRLEKDYSYSSNDALLLNYNGISHFSSVYEGKTNELLGDYLGIFNRFYVTNYNGSTLVTNSLFNIKYVLSEKELPYYEKLYKKYNINVYKNDYNLPIGFMTNDILGLELEKQEPFINQNNILKAMTGSEDDIFYKNNYEIEFNNLKLDKDSKKTTYKKINRDDKASIKIRLNTDHSGILYNYMSAFKFKKVDVLLNGKSIIDINDENGYQCNVLDLGKYEVGQDVELEYVLLENEIQPKDIMFYVLDLEKFGETINKINDKLEIVEYKNNYIRASIDVTSDNQVLYTSIPYDRGFTIIVDGKKVDAFKTFDTLIALKLQQGVHTIEFKYIPVGLKSGLFISVFGVVLFMLGVKNDAKSIKRRYNNEK